MTKITKENVQHLASCMWDAYGVRAGGVTFDGKPLPTWAELGDDRQGCWYAAALEAILWLEARNDKQ
jgi:hypothetical protein